MAIPTPFPLASRRSADLPYPAILDSAAARAPGPSSLQRLLGLWDDLVDERLGIIQSIQELPLDDDDPDFFHYFSSACDTSRFSALKSFSYNGGASASRPVAIAKAMGEAIERYCSAIFAYDDLMFASFDELDRPAVAPEQFALYLPAQYEAPNFPWRPFTRSARVAWTEASSLLSQETVLVPAAMVYVPYYYVRDHADEPIVQPISTGLACGSSRSEAVVSALCEVIERDAFTIFWQARLQPPCVPIDTLPYGCRDLLKRLYDVQVDVKVLDITTDVAAPTILTIALSDSRDSPAAAVAAATDPSAEVALRKSLEELVHTRKFAKQVMQYLPRIAIDSGREYPQVIDARTHLRFYCDQDARQLLDFAWKHSPSRPFSQIADASTTDSTTQLKRLTSALADRGLEPIIKDLTTPDVRELGLYVMRALVPGMHPLFMGHQNRARGGSRLYEVPQQLGYEGLRPGELDHRFPHPFP